LPLSESIEALAAQMQQLVAFGVAQFLAGGGGGDSGGGSDGGGSPGSSARPARGLLWPRGI